MASNPTIVLSAQDNASRVLQSVRGELSRLDGAAVKLRNVLGTLGVSITAGALVSFVRGTINGIDALNDLKDATGSSIENLSALEDVAARTGTSFEAVGTSLVKFNAALNEAKPGSAAARAFEALGLSVKDLKAQDPAEALRRTAVALAGFADDGNKARLVQELFGKSLREVAPFLNDLANQGSLVAKVTAEQAAEAERFNQQLAALAKNSVDAARALTTDLLPAINRVLSNYIKLSNRGLLGELAKDAAKDLVGLGRLSDNALSDLTRLSQELLTLRGQRDRDRFKGKPGLENQALVDEIAQTEKLIQITKIRLGLTDGSAGGGRGFVNPAAAVGKGKPTLSDISVDKAKKVEIEDTTRAVYNYIQSLDKELEKELDLDEVQRARRQLERLGPVSLESSGRVLVLAAQIKKERELKQEREDLLKQAQELDAAMSAGDEAIRKRTEALLAATPARKLEELRRDQMLLAEAFKSGAFGSGPEAEQAYKDAAAALAGITQEQIKETKSLADELGLTFQSAFEDAIVGGKKFSEVLKGLQQDLLRLVVRETITKPLGGFVSEKIKGLFGGFFAAGGDPPLGKASIVGENGPEWFIPRQAGTIVPNGAMGGGNVTVVINQNVGDVVSASMLRDNNRDLVRQIQGSIARSLTHGGALA